MINLNNISIFCFFSIILTVIIGLTLLIDDEKKLNDTIRIYEKNNQLSSVTSLEMYELIEKYSDYYNIPKYIAYNIAYLETNYRGPFHISYKPNLTSSAGAVGPMQVMPSTAEFINKEPISKNNLRNDMELNISTSMKLLNYLYNKYENWAIVCGCYNTGKPILNSYALFCSSNQDYQKNWVEIPDY